MNRNILVIFVMMLLLGTTLTSVGINNKNVKIKIFDEIRDYEFVPGEFIVKFKEAPIFDYSLETLNMKYKVMSVEKAFDDVEGTSLDNIYYFKIPENMDVISAVNEYASLPLVEYAEPNCIIHFDIIDGFSKEYVQSDKNYLSLNTNPNDPAFNRQWSLENTGQFQGTPDCDIDATDAWNIETGSEDVIIAIIDTGVDYTHPDLADNIWINDDEIPDNEVDDDNNGYVDDYHGYDFSADFNIVPLDIFGHGTFCAGIASAVSNNDIGISGVCWNSKIMCLKIFDENENIFINNYIKSLKYAADNGADIFSMSYTDGLYSPYIQDGYIYAYDKDVVLIAAAGNSNTSDTTYFYPANYDIVTAVAATNQRDERCGPADWGYYDDGSPKGSNFGEYVDIAAPANNIYSTMPTYHVQYNDYGWDNNYYLRWGGGTSWATPMVAGIAALLLSQDPTLTNEEVRKIIRANVDPYISKEYIGTGRVNAYKALTRFNTQPKTPIAPLGKSSGKHGREYSFTSSASDSDGDELWYFWDWGDGNYSEWLGPFNSGDTCEASHTWQQEANFPIKVKVKDGKGGESYWSEEFIFSTPKNKIFSTPFQNLLKNHPNLFPMIRQLLKL